MKKSFSLLAFCGLLVSAAHAQPTPAVNPTTPVQAPRNLQILPSSVGIEARLQKMSEQIAALQKENEALKKQIAGLQNDKLESRVAKLEKEAVGAKLVIAGVDKTLAQLKDHTHQTQYSYATLDFLVNTPNSNKPNFYIPYVWLGGLGNVPMSEKIKSVQPNLGRTTPPQTGNN